MGLAVTLSRRCEPCSQDRIQRALESGMPEGHLGVAINLVAASLNSRSQAVESLGWFIGGVVELIGHGARPRTEL